MSYEFIQVTARKENGDFSVCSNLSLMDYQKMTPMQAEIALQKMATDLSREGYNIEWTREFMDELDSEIWGPLFDQAAA